MMKLSVGVMIVLIALGICFCCPILADSGRDIGCGIGNKPAQSLVSNTVLSHYDEQMHGPGGGIGDEPSFGPGGGIGDAPIY
jgi:hypothetical protein